MNETRRGKGISPSLIMQPWPKFFFFFCTQGLSLVATLLALHPAHLGFEKESSPTKKKKVFFCFDFFFFWITSWQIDLVLPILTNRLIFLWFNRCNQIKSIKNDRLNGLTRQVEPILLSLINQVIKNKSFTCQNDKLTYKK